MRQVKRLNPASGSGQGELFDVWRHHAVFTTSPYQMLQAETQHRGHAIVEQLIADAKNSALAHLSSASFAANAAWATCCAIAHNLARATAVLASPFHARATTPTIREHLINGLEWLVVRGISDHGGMRTVAAWWPVRHPIPATRNSRT